MLTLLETLIVVCTLLAATTITTVGIRAVATTERPEQAQWLAIEAAQNSATELIAATAYDQDALSALTAAQWQVQAPGGQAIRLAVATSPQGQAQTVVIHYAAGSVQGDLPITLRALTLSPGSIVGALPSPNP